MPARRHSEEVAAWPPRDRQWRRAALALALLFASLPVASRLFLGNWGFDGAWSLSCLCLMAATYLYLAGRKRRRPLPDSATMLGTAIRLARSGETVRAIAVLDRALRLSPRLWQARQYRGQIRLAEPDAAGSALQDLTEAIRLAPDEPHLYLLRSRIFTLLGEEASAQADMETAAGLGGDIEVLPES